MSIQKSIVRLALFFNLVICTIAYAADNKIPLPNTYRLNGQEWTLGFKDVSQNGVIAEYVTNNEKIANWTQLFTYQAFAQTFPSSVTTKMLVEASQKQLEEMKLDADFNAIEVADNEAIIEFKIKNPEKDRQDELQRLVLSKDGKLVVIHYVIKKADMGETARKLWIKSLKNVQILPNV